MTNLAAVKRRVFERLNALARDASRAPAVFAPDLAWHGQHPVNDGVGREGWVRAALAPLIEAMPDVERRDDILNLGVLDGAIWIAAMGHYCGTFTKPLFGIPATGHLAFLRYGEFYRVDESGTVLEVVTLWDLIGLMQQAGVDPLPPAAGVSILTPGPRGQTAMFGRRLRELGAQVGQRLAVPDLQVGESLVVLGAHAVPFALVLLDTRSETALFG